MRKLQIQEEKELRRELARSGHEKEEVKTAEKKEPGGRKVRQEKEPEPDRKSVV